MTRHPAARAQFRRAVGRGIVDHNNFGERHRLRVQAGQKAIQQIRAIVYGNTAVMECRCAQE